MKKILKILTIITLIITTFQVVRVYGKFITLAEANVPSNVASWVIKVNEMDIYEENGSSKTINVDSLIYTSTDTVNNKISPGNTGHTQIKIDPTGTQVAVKYSVEADFSGLANYNLKFECSVNNRTTSLKRTAKNKYTGILLTNDIQSGIFDNLDCTITWVEVPENSEAETLNGSIYGQSIGIPLTVTVSQYLGEAIVEYAE